MRFTTHIILFVCVFVVVFLSNVKANNNIYFNTDSVQELISSKNFNKAREFLELLNSNDKIEHWEYLRYSGKLCYYEGNYSRSIDELISSSRLIISIYANQQDSILSYIYNNIGISFYKTGNYNKAISYFKDALELKKKYFSPNDEAFISGYNNIAILYRRNGEFDKALEYFTVCENIAKQNNSKKKYGSILLNKASLYKNLGRLEEAIVQYNASIDIGIGAENLSSVANAYNNIGNLYVKLSQYDEAIINFENCISVREKNDLLGSDKVYGNLGLAYFRIEEFDLAEEYYFKSIEFSKSLNEKENADLSNTFLNLAELYLNLGKYDNTIFYLDEASKYVEHNLERNHPQYLRTLTLRAEFEKELKNYDKAIETYNLALSHHQNNEFRPFAEELSYLHLSSKKAELLKLKAEENSNPESYKEALKIYSELTDLIHRLNASYYHESNQLRFIESKKSIIDNGLLLSHQLFEETKNEKYLKSAFYFSEMGKASVLNSSLNEQRALAKSNIPDSLIQREKNINTQIAYYENTLYNDDGTMSEKARNNLLRLYKQKEQLVDFFETSYSAYYNLKYKPLEISLEEFQASLAENELAFEYTIADSNLFIMCIEKEQVEIKHIQIDSNFIADLFYLHNFVNYNSWINSDSKYFQIFKQTSHRVYSQLFAHYTDKMNDKRVVIIPDAELSYIPFEILLKQDDELTNNYTDLSYLVKDHAISYKYSATTFKYFENDKKQFSNQLVAFAPSYQGSNEIGSDNTRGLLTALEGAKEEIKNISKYFASKKYIGKNATESMFKNELNNAGIVHLALHGLIDEEKPMLSKLAFYADETEKTEDGFLNMYEVFNLKLNIDLLVLSACNTGFGSYKNGEGIISFARSFIYAGCPSIVMTLWPINDLSGSKIMQDFYKYLSKEQSKDEALRSAKLEYLNNSDPTKTHPYFWAGYVNMGNTEQYETELNKKPYYAYVSVFMMIVVLLLFFYKRK